MLWLATARHAWAQDSATPAVAAQGAETLPANDDVADGTDTTDIGLLQVELGGVFTRPAAGQRGGGTPLMLRYGAFEWLEVSAGTDGFLAQQAVDTGAISGLGNTLLGARLRLFAARGGMPIVSVLPALTLPTASAAKGLGSGDTDATLALLSGRDLPMQSHVDVSYGVGAIGTGDGSHFTQHTTFVSGSLGITRAWTPGLTLTWISRQDTATGRALTASADSVLTLSRRLALDASATFGLTRQAPAFEIAAGLSVVLGELDLDDGVHARRHRLRWRAKKRPKHRPTTPDTPAPPINTGGVSRLSFDNPLETMVLPVSASQLMVTQGNGGARQRVTTEYRNYRRFLTGGRIVPGV